MTWSIIYVQDMNHRMQTTQERSKYALVINSVKFMQQTSLPQSGGDSNVLTNNIPDWRVPSLPTWQVAQKSKKALKTPIFGTYTGSQTFFNYAIHWYELYQWLSAAAMLHVDYIHCFTSQTSRILVWALLHCFPDFIVMRFRPELLRWPHI